MMNPIDTKSQTYASCVEKNTPQFAIIPSRTPSEAMVSQPIVDIHYINSEEIGTFNQSKSKPKPTEDVTKNYSAIRLRKNRSQSSIFSLSNTGIAMTGIGALEFFAAKQYIAGSLLFGGGLIAYGVGQSLEQRK